MTDHFDCRDTLHVDGTSFTIHSLRKLEPRFHIGRLPYAFRVLLENLLRHQGDAVSGEDVTSLAAWHPGQEPREIAFTPSRVVLQDFTGVPAAVDLAAMREAVVELGGSADTINPLSPVDLVIDHSVQVDHYQHADAADLNAALEFQRNRERYAFLRWSQESFDNFRVVPPDTGIVHQVNLEYLAQVVCRVEGADGPEAFPDTLVGTDSHTTMINGLGVLGWGVGGIEAEAGMLGQPISMLLPSVVGCRLHGKLREGVTATDLVLTLTHLLREHGVVGKFVEFHGAGLDQLALADRATIANMAPEYGATCALFPVDQETLDYLRLSGREPSQVALVEAYCRAQRLFREPDAPDPEYSEQLSLDLGSVEPVLAGPRRPQDRVALSQFSAAAGHELHRLQLERTGAGREVSRFENEGGSTAISAEEAAHVGAVQVADGDHEYLLRDGAVVIAAITSCTNTSNPAVMLAAGLVARRARERGLSVPPWVKTSLAPGSQVVTEYLRRTALLEELEGIGFHVVGYGCTTCIGNSGPLTDPVTEAIHQGELFTAAVLSGNRNFEGRIHPLVRMNWLASPPLVVAFALAGSTTVDITREPLTHDPRGNPVYLRELWPNSAEVAELVRSALEPGMFNEAYRDLFRGDRRWRQLPVPEGTTYRWEADSTYIRRPPFFDRMGPNPPGLPLIRGARVLAWLGDSVTTDHISPAGAIPMDSPAGRYLLDQGVGASDFNSYGARRGNHEVMVRGTFASIRLRNRLVPETEGGWTHHQPGGELLSIHEAAERYQQEQIPLVILAGREYGTGSSRDWASKGPRLLGVRAVIAESFERIHRSNLVGMGILPLQFEDGASADQLGLDGSERFTVEGLVHGRDRATVLVSGEDGSSRHFEVRVRIDTPMEWEYMAHGGILHYVLRQLSSNP